MEGKWVIADTCMGAEGCGEDLGGGGCPGPFLSLSLSHKGKAETTPITWASVAPEVEGRASE